MTINNNNIRNGNTYERETFLGLDFAGQRVESVDFFDVAFERCNFQNCVFHECKFENCRLVDCDLSLTKFKDTSFMDVNFEGCKMLGINWTDSGKSFFSINFEKCLISDSIYTGLSLKEIRITDCLAKRVDFEGTDLTGADCRSTDFEEANFHRTNLTRADLTNAKNYSIDPSVNILRKTRFSMPEAISLLSNLDIIID